jgi:hypothetical protein
VLACDRAVRGRSNAAFNVAAMIYRHASTPNYAG